MNKPAPPVSARLGRLRWISLLNLVVSVLCLAMALVAAVAFPSVVTGLVVPVAGFALYAAVGSRRSYKRTATVLSLAAAHKAAHASAQAAATAEGISDPQ